MKSIKETKTGKITRVSNEEALIALVTGDFRPSSKQAWKKQIRNPEKPSPKKEPKKTRTRRRETR